MNVLIRLKYPLPCILLPEPSPPASEDKGKKKQIFCSEHQYLYQLKPMKFPFLCHYYSISPFTLISNVSVNEEIQKDLFKFLQGLGLFARSKMRLPCIFVRIILMCTIIFFCVQVIPMNLGKCRKGNCGSNLTLNKFLPAGTLTEERILCSNVNFLVTLNQLSPVGASTEDIETILCLNMNFLVT